MEPELSAYGLPLTEKKARRARQARSPRAQFAWLVGVALIGFSATSASMWYGPEAVEYVRGLAGELAGQAQKTRGALRFNPLAMPAFKRALDNSKTPLIPPPSYPQFTTPWANGMPVPNPGGGGRSFDLPIQR